MSEERTMKSPLDLIKEHFQFLIDKYNFRISKEEFSPEAMGNAYITYASILVGILITIDRGQVLINIGEITDEMKDWFDFEDVLGFFNPTIENAYIFIEKTNENKTEEILAIQLARLASLLQKDCQPILNGELWMKDKIKIIEKIRVEKMFDELNKLSKQFKKEN